MLCLHYYLSGMPFSTPSPPSTGLLSGLAAGVNSDGSPSTAFFPCTGLCLFTNPFSGLSQLYPNHSPRISSTPSASIRTAALRLLDHSHARYHRPAWTAVSSPPSSPSRIDRH